MPGNPNPTPAPHNGQKPVASDWAAGTTVVPGLVNITMDASGAVSHVGMAYDVYFPSGAHARSSAMTWANIPAQHGANLNAALGALFQQILTNEGLASGLKHP